MSEIGNEAAESILQVNHQQAEPVAERGTIAFESRSAAPAAQTEPPAQLIPPRPPGENGNGDCVCRTNYVFVDFENVQETDLDRVANKPVKIVLGLGERHKNLPVTLVRLMLKYAAQVQLVQAELTAKNALDFVIACEVGVQSEKDPQGYFHVVSRDTGFDALITFLKSKRIRAARHAAFSEIPILMNLAERVNLLATHLKVNEANRPKTVKSLESRIQTLFGKILTPKELEQTIHRLLLEKIIEVLGKGEVTYNAAAEAASTKKAAPVTMKGPRA